MAVNPVESTELLCPKNHYLLKHNAEYHKCDMCGRRFTEGNTSWYCKHCDYDLCDICEEKFETGQIILDCIEGKGEISVALKDYDKSDLEEFCNACYMDVRDIMSLKSRKRNVGIWLSRIKQYIPQEEIPLKDALYEIQQNFDKGVVKLENAVTDMVTIVQPEFVSKSRNVIRAFDRAQDLLEDIKKLRTPRILVIGNASSGKSSLMNLFLGTDVLKVGPEAGVTTTICEIVYSKERKVCTTTFEGKTEAHDIPAESDDKLYKLLEPFTSAARQGGNEIIQFKDIKFSGPFDVLKSGLSLLDTPGLNDSEKSDKYIQEVASSSFATIVVLPCGDAEVPLNVEKMIETMKRQQGADFNPRSIFFVVTKADKETDGDRVKILDVIERSIGRLVGITANMFVVNLKEALEVRQFGMRSPKHTDLVLGLKDFFEGMLTSYLNSGWQATFEALSVCSSLVNNRLNQKGMTLEQMMEQCDLQQSALQIVENKLANATRELTDIQIDEVQKFATSLQNYVASNKDKLNDAVWKYHPKEGIESVDDRQKYIEKTILQTVLQDTDLQKSYSDAQKTICDAALKWHAEIVRAARTIDSDFYFPNLQDEDGESKEYVTIGGALRFTGGALAVNQGALLGFMALVDIALVGSGTAAGAATIACLGLLGLAGVAGIAVAVGGTIALVKSGATALKAPVQLIQYLVKSYQVSDTVKLAKLIIDETSRDENNRATALSEELFAVIQKVISEVLLKLQNDVSSKQEMLDNLKSSSVLNQKELESLTEYQTGLADIEAQLQRIHYENIHSSELNSEQLQISDVPLFEGNCVSVYSATYKPQKDFSGKQCMACGTSCAAPPESMTVCAKLFKNDFSFRKFMQEEQELRRSYLRSRALDYYGVVKRNGDIYLITEFPSGSLHDILTRATSLTLEQVTSHALEIATSLKLLQQLQKEDKKELFLSGVQPHHLNAENIVVTESKQDTNLKIGIFHDCEDLKESVDGKDDIFNFGTVLWVLWHGIQPGQVIIKSTEELTCRVDCPDRLVKLIQTCRSSAESENVYWNSIIKELVALLEELNQ